MTDVNAPHPLTVAYVALGAAAAIEAIADAADASASVRKNLNEGGGRMGLMARIVSDPAIARLDHWRAAARGNDRGAHEGFYADCARNFGYHAAAASLNGDLEFDAAADARKLIEKHLGVTPLSIAEEKKTILGELEDLTIAYAAIGAARAIDARGGIPDDVMDQFQGEIGLIRSVIQDPSLLWMDKAALENEDGIDGVFAYECAEPFGHRLAEAALAGRPVDSKAIAEELLRDVMPSEQPARP
jgi:hypothetical protein